MGGFDALVSEHLGDCVDVRAECDLECSKGMAEGSIALQDVLSGD